MAEHPAPTRKVGVQILVGLPKNLERNSGWSRDRLESGTHFGVGFDSSALLHGGQAAAGSLRWPATPEAVQTRPEGSIPSPSAKKQCARGGTGRHTGLRSRGHSPWRFESSHADQASVAQRTRAPPYEGGGRRFESCPTCQGDWWKGEHACLSSRRVSVRVRGRPLL